MGFFPFFKNSPKGGGGRVLIKKGDWYLVGWPKTLFRFCFFFFFFISPNPGKIFRGNPKFFFQAFPESIKKGGGKMPPKFWDSLSWNSIFFWGGRLGQISRQFFKVLFSFQLFPPHFFFLFPQKPPKLWNTGFKKLKSSPFGVFAFLLPSPFPQKVFFAQMQLGGVFSTIKSSLKLGTRAKPKNLPKIF